MKDFAKMLFKGKYVAWSHAHWNDHKYLITQAVTRSVAERAVSKWDKDNPSWMNKFEVVPVGKDEADALMAAPANIYPKAPFRCVVRFAGRFRCGSAWWFYMNDPIDSVDPFLLDFTARMIKSMSRFITD